jgi:hypothetical protein
MRFIKSQTTNLRSVKGKGVKYDINDNIILDSNKVVIIPKGTTSERPVFPESGSIRYNTAKNTLESYANGIWKTLRFQEPATITQQNLGTGDANETFFGPLDSGDPDYPIPATQKNVLVFIENVFQISGTNYFLTQNPAGKPEGWYIEFTSPPDFDKPITVLHNFDK